MLRLIFVALLAITGIAYAVQSSLYTLLFYLWIAYFRPEGWVWDVALIQSLNLSLLCGAFLLLRAPFAKEVKYRLDLRTGLLFLLLALSLASTLTSQYSSYS